MTSLSELSVLSPAEREATLDDLLIRSIEKLDSIIALRNDLNRYMETGMIDLARARYATGGPRSAISSLCFNLGHMEATKRVTLDPISTPELSTISSDDVLRFRLEAAQTESIKSTQTKQPPVETGDVHREKNGNGNNTDADQQKNNKENAQLRKRQVPSLNSEASIDRDSLECSDPARSSLDSTAPSDATDLDQLNANSARGTSSISGYSSDHRESSGSNTNDRQNSKDLKTRANDPLRWFGVLVPSSLRTSKECFDRALEVLTEVATQQNELARLLDAFQQLQNYEQNSSSRNVNIEKLAAL